MPVPPPLKLPGREAADVDVVLVEARVVATTGKLDLELHLVVPHRQVADRARSADSWSAPGAVGSAAREISSLQYLAGLRAQCLLFHPACSSWRDDDSRCASAERPKPDAVGVGACRARPARPEGRHAERSPCPRAAQPGRGTDAGEALTSWRVSSALRELRRSATANDFGDHLGEPPRID